MKLYIFSMLYELVMFIFSILLGLAVMPQALRNNDRDDEKIVSFFCAPLIGFSVFLILSFFLGNVFPYNKLLVIILFALSALYIFLHRDRLFMMKNKAALLFLSAIYVLSFYTILGCTPSEIDGGIYFKSSSYDHQRTALIDSIALAGLPLRSPWIADNGNLLTDSYHCGLNAVMAQPVMLFGMWALEAGAGINGLIFLLVMSTLAALTYRLTGKKLSWIFLILLYFSSDPGQKFIAYLSPYWQGLFSPGEYYQGTGSGSLFGFWPLFNDVIWSPHSVFGGCCALFLIYLFSLLSKERDKTSSAHLAVIMGLMAGAAFVSNVYSGLIALFLFFISLIPIYIFSKDFRKDFNTALPFEILMAAVGLLVSAPFLYNLLFSQKNSDVGVIFGVLPPFDSAKGIFAVAKAFIDFSLVTLTARYGIFNILGIVAVGIPNVLPKERFTKIAAFYSLVILTLVFFCRSNFYSNDWGWRMPLASKLFCLCCGTVLLAKCFQWLYKKKAFFAYSLVAGIIALGVVFSDSLITEITPMKYSAPERHTAFAKASEGWKEVRKYTRNTDLVLSNPLAFNDVAIDADSGVQTSFFFSYYAGRFSAMADINLAQNIIGEEEMPRFEALYQFVTDFFTKDPSKEDVRYIAEEMKVSAILVTPDDALWENDDALFDLYEKKSETDGYKVFIIKS